MSPFLLQAGVEPAIDLGALLESPYTIALVAVVVLFGYKTIQAIAENLRKTSVAAHRYKFLSRMADKGLLRREDLETVLYEQREGAVEGDAGEPVAERDRVIRTRERSFLVGFILMALSAGFFAAGLLAGVAPLYIPGSIVGALGLALASYGAARREVMTRIRRDVERGSKRA